MKERGNILNHNFFTEIDSKEKAYCYGFIVGDGSVRPKHKKGNGSLNIGINSKDVDVLDKISEVMEFKRGPIIKDKYCYVCMISNQIVEDLMNVGVIPNKSTKDIGDLFIPMTYLFHFLRGLMDSDGELRLINGQGRILSFYQGRNNKNLILRVKKILSDLYNIEGSYDDRGYSHRLRFSGINCSNLLKLLYTDATIYCDRKQLVAKEILNKVFRRG